MGNIHIIIGTVYLPSDLKSDMYETYCCVVEDVVARHSGTPIIIVGDFNLSRVFWVNDPDNDALSFRADEHCSKIN